MTGDSSHAVSVEGLRWIGSAKPKRWLGEVRLPNKTQPTSILIFEQEGRYLAFSSRCPHEGQDLSRCRLESDNSVVCPAHGLVIRVVDVGFVACREGEDFFIPLGDNNRPVPWQSVRSVANRADRTSEMSAQIEKLKAEIKHLEVANAKKESRILTISHSMDAMLRELEVQRDELKHANRRQLELTHLVQSVMHTMHNLLIVVGQDGRISQINEAVTRELGYHEDDVVGRLFDDFLCPAETASLERQLPEVPWPVQSVMLETIRRHDGYQAEHRLLAKRKGGRPLLYLLTGAQLHNKRGRFEGVVVNATNITPLKEREEKLAMSEEKFRLTANAAHDAIVLVDSDDKIYFWNQAAERIFGYRQEEVIGHELHRLLVPTQYREAYDKGFQRFKATGRGPVLGVTREVTALTKDGAEVPVEVGVSAVKISDDWHSIGLLRDISARRRNEEQLRLAASVFHNSMQGIMITDSDGTIVSVNPAFTKITGYSPDDVLGKTPAVLSSDRSEETPGQDDWSEVVKNGEWQGEVWYRRKDGEVYLQWQTVSMIAGPDGKPLRYVVIFSDITELRRKDEHIRHLAYHDPLTALPNRQLLLDRLGQALFSAKRHREFLAVLFLDLDHFKVVNDSLGHDVGDHLLRTVAERLSYAVRHSDTVARLGGDEFVVLVRNPTSSAAVAHLAEKIIGQLVEPVVLGGHTLHVSTSIGISQYPTDGEDANELLKNADTAMYAAKASGRNAFHFFNSMMNLRVVKRLELEAEIRSALEHAQFELFYQPKICLRTNRPSGAEALIRWRHPSKGLISPVEFIPFAEESGLILAIGDRVLEMACRQLRDWIGEGIAPGHVSVNLSGRQLKQKGLINRVEGLLREYRLDPSLLEIELTESTVMEESDQAIAMLTALRDIGINISIDDFGTGYSSLSTLKKLPISTIKIDRAFIKDLETNQEDAEIIKTVVSLGVALKLNVITEGVETDGQVAFLKAIGCPMAQGYKYSKPLVAKDYVDWLHRKAVEISGESCRHG